MPVGDKALPKSRSSGKQFYPDFSKYVTIQFSCVSCALYLAFVGLLTLAVKQGVLGPLQKTNPHLKRFLFLYNVTFFRRFLMNHSDELFFVVFDAGFFPPNLETAFTGLVFPFHFLHGDTLLLSRPLSTKRKSLPMRICNKLCHS